MKSTPKIKPLFVIALGIVITFSTLIIIDLNSTTGNSDKIFGQDGKLEISAVSGKIHIDNNWTAAKALSYFPNVDSPIILELILVNFLSNLSGFFIFLYSILNFT